MIVSQSPNGDYVCEHGTAVDVHCCNCHNGFIFDLDHECPPMTDHDPRIQLQREYTLDDYRNAPSGIGPLAGEWADKPHRLIYDLVNRLATVAAVTRESLEGREGRIEPEPDGARLIPVDPTIANDPFSVVSNPPSVEQMKQTNVRDDVRHFVQGFVWAAADHGRCGGQMPGHCKVCDGRAEALLKGVDGILKEQASTISALQTEVLEQQARADKWELTCQAKDAQLTALQAEVERLRQIENGNHVSHGTSGSVPSEAP